MGKREVRRVGDSEEGKTDGGEGRRTVRRERKTTSSTVDAMSWPGTDEIGSLRLVDQLPEVAGMSRKHTAGTVRNDVQAPTDHEKLNASTQTLVSTVCIFVSCF